MREILFRGKRIDNGEWVYGNLIINKRLIETAYKISSQEGIDSGKNYIFSVDPKSIGQFTDLADKNGKKIFIDDIVEAKQSSFIQRGVVTQLSDGLYVFKGWRYHDLTDFKLKDVNLERCLSVIGNIHDNPKLLEVKK